MDRRNATIADMSEPPPAIDERDVGLLVELFYADLQRLARGERARVRHRPETMQTTALVHEAYLKLAGQVRFRSHGHFLATAALAMRQVLVGRARQRMAAKRGEGVAPLPLDVVLQAGVEGAVDDERLIALSDALEELEKHHPRLARVIECRWFAGYSEAETAVALGVTDRTVQRDWAKAKALLYEALGA